MAPFNRHSDRPYFEDHDEHVCDCGYDGQCVDIMSWVIHVECRWSQEASSAPKERGNSHSRGSSYFLRVLNHSRYNLVYSISVVYPHCECCHVAFIYLNIKSIKISVFKKRKCTQPCTGSLFRKIPYNCATTLSYYYLHLEATKLSANPQLESAGTSLHAGRHMLPVAMLALLDINSRQCTAMWSRSRGIAGRLFNGLDLTSNEDTFSRRLCCCDLEEGSWLDAIK